MSGLIVPSGINRENGKNLLIFSVNVDGSFMLSLDLTVFSVVASESLGLIIICQR